MISIAVATTFILSVGVVVLMGMWKGRDIAFFGAGLGTMSVGFVLWFAVQSREARRLFDAAEAERFTAGVARRLRWRGWRSVDHVEFDGRDIDHVVAGPGGVFAVETKWTNHDWQITNGSFDNRYAVDAVVQCRDGAWRIGWLLRGNYNHQCDVRPLLVIWGPGRPALHDAVLIDDVLVVPGHLLRRTLAQLDGALDSHEVKSVIREVEHFVGRREDHKSKHQPPLTRPAI